MSQCAPTTDSQEIAQRIKGLKAPFKCPACQKVYKSLSGLNYHIGQVGPSTPVPRCLAEEQSQPPQNGVKTRRSATPTTPALPTPSAATATPSATRAATPSTTRVSTPVTRATTAAAAAAASTAQMAASLIASHPSSPAGSVGGVAASGRRRPRRELTWGEAQRLVEVEFGPPPPPLFLSNNYKRVEIDCDLDISDEERQPVAEEASSLSRRSGAGTRTPQKRGGRASIAPSETPNRNSASTGKPAKLSSSVKDKCKRRSKPKSKNDVVALPKAEVDVIEGLEFSDAPCRSSSYYRFVEQSAEDLDENVEYDMDEEDYQWLSLMNEDRKSQGLTNVPQEVFEVLMDRMEKECVFESQSFVDGEDQRNMYNIDENAVCCICNDGECHNTNAILFCDMCNLAVHQECYGVPYIPEGQWLCRRCIESPSRGVDCALCPNKGGAFKRTLDTRWAHVICAIWIPEVQFANPVFLEPIDGIREIPSARWKLTCYICRRRMGACIQCAKSNCCTAFHVTCAQQACLHMKMEPAKGGTVKKIAYCDAHTPPSVKKKLEKVLREQEMRELMTEGKGEGKASGKDGSEKSANGEEGSKEETDSCKGKKELEEAEEVDVEGKDSVFGEGSKKEKDGHSTNNNEDSDDSKPHRTVSSSVLRARKMMEEKRGQSNVPVVNIPFVPQNKLDHIVSTVSVMKKSQLIPKLVNYWKLKRQSRNGVPLLRRLQANKGLRASATNLSEEERSVLVDQLALWNSLRHDLERARMLVELIRKREKLKREQLRLLMIIGELQLRPLNHILRKAMERIVRKDPAKIFAEPVSIEDVPDYLDIIRKPMDFSTMQAKLEGNQYTCLEDFEKDFKLVWHNATIYNQKDTIYYKAAIRIKEAGQKVLEQAKLQVATAGVHSKTGLHHPEVEDMFSSYALSQSSTSSSDGPASYTPNPPIDVLDMNDESMLDSFRGRHYSTTSQELSMEEQMDVLQEKLQMLQGHPNVHNKEKALRKELCTLRRQKNRRKNSDEEQNSPGSPRRQRAASIPRNAEELASHLIHGSLRFTPSRHQIISHSGIRLEERASALKKEQEEASRGSGEDQSGQQVEKNRRNRLQSNSDSMLLTGSKNSELGRRKGRGRSSEPAFSATPPSDENYKMTASNASEQEKEEEEEKDVLPSSRKRKRPKDMDDFEDIEPKRKIVKKKRKERHKPSSEDAKTQPGMAATPKDSPAVLSSSRSRTGASREAETKPKREVLGKRKRKVRKDDNFENDYEDEDDEEQVEVKEKDAMFTLRGRPKRNRNKKSSSPVKSNKGSGAPRKTFQTRLRIRSSDTVTTESEVEGAQPVSMATTASRRVNGTKAQRSSGRLGVALRSSSMEESDSGFVRRRQQDRQRSISSSIYETAGEAEFSEAETKRSEKKRRVQRKPMPRLSDSENRDVFSEGGGTTPPPSARDVAVPLNDAPNNNNSSNKQAQEGKVRSHKKKRGLNADLTADKLRANSDGSLEGQVTKTSMLNGLVVNGEASVVEDEIKPMELVWAKCRGYPPYPALVINPDIPECGINVRGEKILPPSDEVMELKEKNPTSTYLVRFFDGRRTWQCLPPEKIEPLGVSQESDNAKIAMAGSSKRSVKEALSRAKQWQQRMDKKGGSTSKLSSHASDASNSGLDMVHEA